VEYELQPDRVRFKFPPRGSGIGMLIALVALLAIGGLGYFVLSDSFVQRNDVEEIGFEIFFFIVTGAIALIALYAFRRRRIIVEADAEKLRIITQGVLFASGDEVPVARIRSISADATILIHTDGLTRFFGPEISLAERKWIAAVLRKATNRPAA
jgi:membrane protein YdbS with pleckstrin-like domain